jgi:MFS superfamily sulfate permease-like transporter
VTLDENLSKVKEFSIVWSSSPDLTKYNSYFSTPEVIESPTKISGQNAYAFFLGRVNYFFLMLFNWQLKYQLTLQLSLIIIFNAIDTSSNNASNSAAKRGCVTLVIVRRPQMGCPPEERPTLSVCGAQHLLNSRNWRRPLLITPPFLKLFFWLPLLSPL